MSDMQGLDERVRSFAAETLEREGVVTGWVLMIATSRFDEDGELLHAVDYSCGPGTDLVRAFGLVEVGRMFMQQSIDGRPFDR